jgi:hypothetical protein
VFAVKDLKDEYVWDSATGAKVRKRWGQLSEKEIIGTTADTVATTSGVAHGLDMTKIVSATGMVNRVADCVPIPCFGFGGFTTINSFFISTAEAVVVNTTTLDPAYLSQPFIIEIRYREW